MQRKTYAAAAIALVAGGVTAQSSVAALNNPAIVDPSFELSGSTGTYAAYNYNNGFVGWLKSDSDVDWDKQADTAIANGAGNTFVVLETTTANGVPATLYQQIGTTDPGATITATFLAADKRDYTGAVTVSLYSGGTTVQTYDGGTENTATNNYNDYTLTGATLLSTTSFSNLALDSFTGETATLAEGTAGVSGAPLWLVFGDTTLASEPQLALDNVAASETAATPEPASLSVVGIALLAMRGRFDRRRKF